MQDKSYCDNNDTDPYVIKTTTTRDLLPHSIRLRDEWAYRSRSSTPPDLSNIPIYTYSNTDRSTPARSADSHKSPFRTLRRTNLSRTFRTPSRTRSTSVPNTYCLYSFYWRVSFCVFWEKEKRTKFPKFQIFDVMMMRFCNHHHHHRLQTIDSIPFRSTFYSSSFTSSSFDDLFHRYSKEDKENNNNLSVFYLC